MNRCVFLDRDGTLTADDGYEHRASKLRFLPGVLDGLKLLVINQFKLIIITNQSGIGRGIFTESDMKGFNTSLVNKLNDASIAISGIYYCPHHPKDKCKCRKPHPQMILDAAIKHTITLKDSFMVGDKLSDVEAGKRAGVKTILIADKIFGESSSEIIPDFNARTFLDAATLIINSMKQCDDNQS